MKRFLKIFLFFFLGLILLAAGLDVMISSGLRKSGLRKYVVWSDIYRGQIDADLVVLGSSRAWCTYNTYMLDTLLHGNSYNLGIDGHQLDMQLIRYDTYRRFNPAPDVILLNTDFLSTFSILADPRYEREQFFPFMADRELVSRVKEQKDLTLLDRYCPLARYYGYRKEIDNGVAAFFGKRDFDDMGLYKGYRGNDYPWKDVLPSVPSRNILLDTSLVSLLDGFVRKSQEEGIQVVFVKSPVYTPALDSFVDLDTFDSTLAEIADRYKIPVLDYTRAPFCSDSTFFYNASHLNRRGSELFTGILCEDLKQEGLMRPPLAE